ncbi:YciI family protein [Sulfurimonas diazotrophicus]|uniref:YciI family protein n=1 Tax=Sulfurimonas diazotrophicus TaxID=3131939 RepID=A0ABZ3HDN4_9BACT
MYRYLITTFRTPQFDPSVIDAHYAFLDDLRQRGKLELAGPFTDKSGGAYLIKADSLEEAEAIAFSDPVHTSKSSIVTVYEWNAK